jgi:hypothetical protein
MKLLHVTGSLWLSFCNVAMNAYRWNHMPVEPGPDRWSMIGHVSLMQIAMTIIFVQFAGRHFNTSIRWHMAVGVAMCCVFVVNIPFALHLVYLMFLRRHWWHGFVQMTSLFIVLWQLYVVVKASRLGKDRHREEVVRLVSIANGASGSRLLGNVYALGLGVDPACSYTLGLSTMFLLFLLPQVVHRLRTLVDQRRIKQH